MRDRDSQQSKSNLLRMRDLKSEYGLSPASVYRWIGEGTFPLPVNLGRNSVAWHLEEIKEWCKSRPRAKIKVRAGIKAMNGSPPNANPAAEEGAQS